MEWPPPTRLEPTSPLPDLSPDNTVFVAIAFEGPDPYAQAGGLGVRMTGLTQALADRGFPVHFFFVGDPQRDGVQTEGRLTLYRWGQWISQYHAAGVYAGEFEKKADLDVSMPPFVVEHIARPAIRAGKRVVVLAEEWHTADVAMALSDLLHREGLRQKCAILWNANHRMGLDRINFARLGFVSTITTVSRFMRQIVEPYGANPVVIPNGIGDEWLAPVPRAPVDRLRRRLRRPLLVKIGRFDPDKRWIMAIEALAGLKGAQQHPLLLMRGGLEPHGGAVIQRAYELGLTVQEVHLAGTPDLGAVLRSLEAEALAADIIHLRMFLPRAVLPVLYRAADAVLVNSGFEPFGLVGLEVMASGGLAITGGTGEDYARSFVNGLGLDGDDPRQLAQLIRYACNHRPLRQAMVREGMRTARSYRWAGVIDQLLGHVALAFERQTSAERPG
ncbi:MAG: glycosyltransferase family 4 protein [Thermaerobacter sp.]|nr:glycosyltransferase family 4 protein [Thermaerobacter sp.]